MKKNLVAAMTSAMVIGLSATSFAATNPFTDVPTDHWAYDAVAQLAADGVIEGYGDTTFQGDKNITRYEMAQMVAKAMAKENVGTTDKALIDRLATEFADELNNLGVRVASLERNADKVKWNGEARYTYTSERHENSAKSNDDELLLRLEPSAEVNDHWHVKARLEASTDLATDDSDSSGTHGKSQDTNVSLKRIYAEGQYGTTNVKLGKIPMQLDSDLLFDDEISGASVTTGKDLQVTLQAGRYSLDGTNDAITAGKNASSDKTANMQSVGLNYATGNLSLGAAYHHLTTDALQHVAGYSQSASTDDANIWSVGGGYRFDKNFAIQGKYATNTSADNYNKAGTVELDYKGAKRQDIGSWGVYAAYRHLGQNVAFDPSYDGVMAGTKGWEVGADYTLAKNTVASAKYFSGEELASGQDASKLFGRVQFFF